MPIVDDFRASLSDFPSAAPAMQQQILQHIGQWKTLSPDEACAVIEEGLPNEAPVEAEPLLQMALLRLSQTWRSAEAKPMPSETRNRIAALHQEWSELPSARDALLTVLACSAGPEELQIFADLMAKAPPLSHDGAAIAFAPLFQQKRYDPAPLFPALFETLASPVAASAALDLSNFVTRQGLVESHPGADRAESLANLLGGLSQRLEKLTDNPQAEEDEDPDQITAKIAESISLAVALCDALALIGDDSVTPKLYQALEVRHRRLRTEAAAALAQLGDEAGKKALIELAAEPVARLRVIAYANELGIADQISDKFLTDDARAEAELAVGLAQPTYYGVPPSRLEVIDKRELYWPAYDEPIECFLVRFTYSVSSAAGELEGFSNIGIAGPIAHAMAADLTELPLDDVYALFAGWCVQHEEIYDLDLHEISNQPDIDRLSRRIRDADFDAVQPIALHSFFNERVLVAGAVKEGVAGSVAMGADSHVWLPRVNVASPPGPNEAYHLFKGRKVLRSFNEADE